jgi:alpha-D-xyloside xylohydrolase
MRFRFYACQLFFPLLAFAGQAAGASLDQLHTRPDGIEATVGGTRLRVLFVTDRIVRVSATPNPHWSSRASMMRVPVLDKPGPIKVSKDAAALTLRSAALSVTLDRASGALTLRDRDGSVFLREDPTAPRSFERTDVIKSMPDPATVRMVQTVDGERQQVGAYRQAKDREAWSARVRFKLSDDEGLYGLGLDETSDLNLRGTSKRLYQHNLRVVVPFLVSTRGYGLLFDSYSAMTFADGPKGTSVGFDVVDDLDYYVVLGPSMDGAIAGFRQLTGAAEMLPRWAYGYIQSKERYTTQQELVDTVRQFRERKIPLDLIVQDWNYWLPGRWGSPVPDPKRYPDIGAMTSAVHEMNAKVMISIWPNPSPLDPPGLALKDRGFFSSGSGYVDFLRRDAADFYFDQVWDALGRHGIDAWWTDSTEPEVADWNGSGAMRATDADQKNIEGLAKVIDPEWLNAYGLADSQGLARFWHRHAPDKRTVNLTRSGYAGSQATGAVIWSGDISANWRTLAQQVATMQRFSASGLPNVTFDIGGFFVKGGGQWFRRGEYPQGVDDLGYRELYTRWMQAGAFMPLFRSHGTDTPREPWQFGAPGTPFYDAILSAIRLRYRMLPYLYSEAGHAYLDGGSLIRPVAFGYPQDPRTHDLKGEMLFGRGILVSPVVAPMYYGANSTPVDGPRTTQVYLPQGTWFDFWTGQSHPGGQTITVDAPIDRMPIHVRAGTVLPLGPVRQFAAEAVDAPIEVRVYPGADGAYTLYDDAGDGLGYQKGEYARIPLRWNDATRTLTIGARQGRYAGMKRELKFKLVVVGAQAGHGLEDAPDSTATVTYSGDAVQIRKNEKSSS